MNITRGEIEIRMQEDLRWLERAIVAIYERQTAAEQAAGQTREHNGIGFNGVDAPFLTYLAEWILSGKHLSGKFLIKARKRMVKYSGQLQRIAMEKGAR